MVKIYSFWEIRKHPQCLLSQFSQLIVGQMSKSGTVLESWERADFKTVPDFEIWARFDGEIEEKWKGQFFYGHPVWVAFK